MALQHAKRDLQARVGDRSSSSEELNESMAARGKPFLSNEVRVGARHLYHPSMSINFHWKLRLHKSNKLELEDDRSALSDQRSRVGSHC